MRIKLSFTILLTIILALPFSAQARFFDANDILTDAELFNGNALSRTAIQRFLEEKNSILKNTTDVVNGVPKLVSEMIYELGQSYGISQKFLLAKLQQEQGLLEKSTASNTKLDWATGYSCFGGRCNEKYRGIYNQLDAAADVQRIYTERSKSGGYFGYQIGKQTKTSDGYNVTPANQATTNLYIYTPYKGSLTGIGGNFFFSRVWNKYFTDRTYPDGAILRDSISGDVWKIEKNKRRKFVNEAVFLSNYTIEDAIIVPSERLGYYEISEPITTANNSIVKTEESGILYLLSDGLKHRLVGTGALATLGYHIADTTSVSPSIISKAELDTLEEGEPVTETSQYPTGILVKGNTPEIYYVKNGIKQLLLDEAVWQENFNKQDPVYVSQETLNSFTLANPINLAEGALVKDKEGKYFLVSNSKKKRIANAEIVKRVYGIAVYNSVPVASDELLNLTDSGDPIEYIDDTIQDPLNYISYAKKQQNITINRNPYFALFDMLVAPKSMLAGSNANITVRFRNRGDVEWPAGQVYLKLIDDSNPTSSFIKENRIPLNTTATYNQLAIFEVPITAPLKTQKIKQWFILEYTDANGKILEMPGGLKNQEINVISDITAEIVKHNIPIAIKANSNPQDIEVHIKNTSKHTIWTSRRSALMLKGGDETESVFYDPGDWIDKETVGVPINDKYISPGETGIIKFTLDPRNVRPAIYKLIFNMELRDDNESVFINGEKFWELLIRVDR